MSSDVNVTAIVFGAIFGALFMMTCIISAVKAVRDRKRIKERIAQKRLKKLEQCAYDNYAEIESREPHTSMPNISIEVPFNNSQTKSKCNDKSSYKRHDKMPKSPVRLKVPTIAMSDNVPDWNYIPNLKATKNVTRRNSYDMAIGRYTMISSKYGGSPITNGSVNSHGVAYENSAFNCDSSYDVVL